MFKIIGVYSTGFAGFDENFSFTNIEVLQKLILGKNMRWEELK